MGLHDWIRVNGQGVECTYQQASSSKKSGSKQQQHASCSTKQEASIIGIDIGMDFRPPASHLRAQLVRTVGGFWGVGGVRPPIVVDSSSQQEPSQPPQQTAGPQKLKLKLNRQDDSYRPAAALLETGGPQAEAHPADFSAQQKLCQPTPEIAGSQRPLGQDDSNQPAATPLETGGPQDKADAANFTAWTEPSRIPLLRTAH